MPATPCCWAVQCWQIDAASDKVPLLARSGYVREQRWGWRGWLWGPRPRVSAADLDQWLQRTGAPAPDTVEPSPRLLEVILDEMRLVVGAGALAAVCSLSVLLLFVLLAVVSMPGFFRPGAGLVAVLIGTAESSGLIFGHGGVRL